MGTTRVFKLRLATGVQTFRLDEDSVDYDWKGADRDFHGTLPYENLRLKSQIKRRDKTAGRFASVLGLLFISLLLLLLLWFPNSWDQHLLVGGGVLVTNLVAYLTFQHIRGGTICFQIEPRAFGFAGEMPVPDTGAGRAFLLELESAWNESLRRRFLRSESISREAQLQRINWLQFIGVLTSEEAAAERALIDTETQSEQGLIALN